VEIRCRQQLAQFFVAALRAFLQHLIARLLQDVEGVAAALALIIENGHSQVPVYWRAAKHSSFRPGQSHQPVAD
jgi:hypothetical protein